MRHVFDSPLARWLAPAIAIVGAYHGVWIPTAILATIAIYAWKIR